jgi:phosphatidylserine decarboxylase
MLRMSYLLVVINNFDIFRTGLRPAEANPELPVDANAVLALAITRQRLQHIAGRYFKIIKLTCSLELPNFPQGNALEIDKSPDATTACQLLGILTLKRYDHGSILTHRINNVKRHHLAR